MERHQQHDFIRTQCDTGDGCKYIQCYTKHDDDRVERHQDGNQYGNQYGKDSGVNGGECHQQHREQCVQFLKIDRFKYMERHKVGNRNADKRCEKCST